VAQSGDAARVGVSPSCLRDWTEQILIASGVEPADAAVIAEALVQANLRGVDSHGVVRLPQYVEALRAGEVNPRPVVRVRHRSGAVAVVDADGGYGFRPTVQAAELGMETAAEYGAALVAVTRSHHFGMAAFYTMRVAAAEMIGFVTTTSLPVLPPYGAALPVLGNNPISYAIPRRPPHPAIVLDMAMSEVAFGKIRLAAMEGRPIPPAWALDARGQPTTDPVSALSSGMLSPMGGYKGSGLALVNEVLAGVLTGSPFGRKANAHGNPAGGVGHLLMVLHIPHFLPLSRFYADLEQLVAEVKSAPPAPGHESVYLPGEPEWLVMQQRLKTGIPLSLGVRHMLRELGNALGVGDMPF
jgi:LDH2 family malate/lactate/ureidoglycolate dehydrogenase